MKWTDYMIIFHEYDVLLDIIVTYVQDYFFKIKNKYYLDKLKRSIENLFRIFILNLYWKKRYTID